MLRLYDVVSSPRQALGQVVHAALHDMEQAGDEAPEGAALVDAHWAAMEDRFGTRLRELAFRRMAEDAVAQVARFDRERGAEGTEFLVGEASFRWQMAPDMELGGMIDRIDRGPDGLIVLDYKLGAESPSINALLGTFAPPAEPEEWASWRPADLQLPLYALAVERGEVEGLSRLAGERVAAVGLIYPLQLYGASGKPAAAGRRMIRIVDHAPGCAACGPRTGRSATTGELCRDQLQTIADRAMVAIEEMRAGNVEPNPRDGAETCRSCPFRAICPVSLA